MKHFALLALLLALGLHPRVQADVTSRAIQPLNYPFTGHEVPLRSGLNFNDIYAGHAILTRSGATLWRGRTLTAELRFVNTGPSGQWFYHVFSPLGVLALYDARGKLVCNLLEWQGGSLFTGFNQSDWIQIPSGGYGGTSLVSTMPVNVPTGIYSLQMIFFTSFITSYPSAGWTLPSLRSQSRLTNNAVQDGEMDRTYLLTQSRQELFRSNVVKVQIIEEKKPSGFTSSSFTRHYARRQ